MVCALHDAQLIRVRASCPSPQGRALGHGREAEWSQSTLTGTRAAAAAEACLLAPRERCNAKAEAPHSLDRAPSDGASGAKRVDAS
jgi:hypothetical protein